MNFNVAAARLVATLTLLSDNTNYPRRPSSEGCLELSNSATLGEAISISNCLVNQGKSCWMQNETFLEILEFIPAIQTNSRLKRRFLIDFFGNIRCNSVQPYLTLISLGFAIKREHLIIAMRQGCLATVQSIIEALNMLHIRYYFDKPIAVMFSSLEILEYFQIMAKDAVRQPGMAQQFLRMAIKLNRPDTFDLLRKYGANFNHIGVRQDAIFYGNCSTVDHLLRYGMGNVNWVESKGDGLVSFMTHATALHEGQTSLPLLKSLLLKGALINPCFTGQGTM